MSAKHSSGKGGLLLAALALALVAAVLMPAGQALAADVPVSAGAGYASQEGAAVNTAAGSEHGVVGFLGLFEQVEVLARNASGTWVYILFREDWLGWINTDLLLTGVNIGALPVVDDRAAPVGADRSAEVLAQAAAFVGATGTPAPPLAGLGAAKVKALALHVRAGPNTGFRSLGVVYQGAELVVLGRSPIPIWLRVRTPDGLLDGWVAGGEVTTDVPLASLPLVPLPPGDAFGSAVVKAGALNVREGSDIIYMPLGVVYQGDVLAVLGRSSSGAWIKVRAPNGLEGWVASGEVIMDVPFSKLPVISPDEDVFG